MASRLLTKNSLPEDVIWHFVADCRWRVQAQEGIKLLERCLLIAADSLQQSLVRSNNVLICAPKKGNML